MLVAEARGRVEREEPPRLNKIEADEGEPTWQAPAATFLDTAQESANWEDTGTKVEVIRERYPNRAVKIEREVTQDSEGNYINHGSWKMWDAGGNLMAEGQFAQGAREGVWNRWYLPGGAKIFGQLPYQQFPGPFISQATFRNGQIDGTWTIYDSKQRKISEWAYENGVRQGASIWWYANGRVMREANYRDGDLDGEIKQYDPNGKLVFREVYELGRKLAPKTEYHSGGKQKKTEGLYLHAKIVEKTPDDWWNAVPAVTMQVGKDERHGPWSSWYPNGQVQIQGEYKHDLRVGQFTWWYANGQKSAEGFYVDGVPHGRWVWWHENGQKSAQGEYKRGEMIGLWSRWDESGKMVTAEDHSGIESTAQQSSRNRQ